MDILTKRAVFRRMTVEDNLLSVLEMTNLSINDQKKKCEDLLSEFGLQKIRKNMECPYCQVVKEEGQK